MGKRDEAELSGTRGERGDSGHVCLVKCQSLMGLSTKVTLSEDKAQDMKAVAIFGMFQTVFDTGRTSLDQ